MEYYGVKIDIASMTNEEVGIARQKAHLIASRSDLGSLRNNAEDISKDLNRQLLLRKLYAHKHSS